jgi:hypothetical protein
MKKTISILFAGSFILALATGCDNNNTNSKDDTNRTEGTHSTSGEGNTEGTTGSIGTNPTNSTGTTGKPMDINHSTSVSDSVNNNRTHGTTSGSSTH